MTLQTGKEKNLLKLIASRFFIIFILSELMSRIVCGKT